MVVKKIKSKFALLTIMLLFFNTFCGTSQVPVTIFVHGARGLSKLFIKYTTKDNRLIPIRKIPTSCITYRIPESLSQADPSNFPKKYFYVFGWSGKLSHKARLSAAKILYNEIIKLIEELKESGINPTINLITHSHGGNVALNLAQVLPDDICQFCINKLILLACPVQEQTRALVNHALFENVYNIYSTLDLTQVMDPQRRHPENRGKDIPFFSQRTFDCCPKLKQANIKINNHGIPHVGFLTSKFFIHLPTIVHDMDKLCSDPVSLVRIYTN